MVPLSNAIIIFYWTISCNKIHGQIVVSPILSPVNLHFVILPILGLNMLFLDFTYYTTPKLILGYVCGPHSLTSYGTTLNIANLDPI